MAKFGEAVARIAVEAAKWLAEISASPESSIAISEVAWNWFERMETRPEVGASSVPEATATDLPAPKVQSWISSPVTTGILPMTRMWWPKESKSKKIQAIIHTTKS